MSRIFDLHNQPDLREAMLEAAAEALRADQLILYPTDTIYGVGANALSIRAIERVFNLKGRDYTKPINILVRDIAAAEEFVVFDEVAYQIARTFLPGPLTLVLPRKKNIPDLLTAGNPTLGIRIPDHEVCRLLAENSAFPITTTSANLSASPNTYRVSEVEQQLGERFGEFAVVIDDGPLPVKPPSTVVSVIGGELTLIREGALGYQDIMRVIE